MASQSATVQDMASKKTKPAEVPAKKAGRPSTGRKPTYLVYVRIRPSLGTALDAYIAATRPTPTQTAAVELALEEFLTKNGHWPLPTPQNDGE